MSRGLYHVGVSAIGPHPFALWCAKFGLASQLVYTDARGCDRVLRGFSCPPVVLTT